MNGTLVDDRASVDLDAGHLAQPGRVLDGKVREDHLGGGRAHVDADAEHVAEESSQAGLFLHRTLGQDHLHVAMRARDDVHTDQFAHALGGGRPGVGGGLDRAQSPRTITVT